MQRDVKALTEGAIGGVLGTITMSLLMLAARKAGLLGRHPPEVIADKALDALGLHKHSEETRNALAAALHVGFGAASGALFGALHRRLRPRIGGAGQGIVFGSLVWAVSYKGWVPALGILPPPEHDRPGRPVVMLVAHWVYGCTLGSFVEATTKEDASPY